jgi:hypothetical protein
MKRFSRAACLLALATLASGCRLFEPSTLFALKMELGPAEARPPNWGHVKQLAMRPCPQVGTPAPEFTFTTLDGSDTMTRSDFQAGRPLVLIFGSYT